MKPLILSAALSTLLFTLVVSAINQKEIFRASIRANVLTDGPTYADPSQNEHLVFPGTPLVILLRVVNPFNPKVDGGPATVVVETDWPSHIGIRLLAGKVQEAHSELGEVQCQPLDPVPMGRSSAAGAMFFALREGEQFTLNCLLDPGVVNALATGDYTIAVDWTSGGDLRRHPAESLKDLTGFEIRAAKGAMDNLEVQLRLMLFALRQRQYDRAIEFADKALTIEPFSAQALAGRSEANAAMRRCDDAKADIERAARALESGSDGNARPTGQDPRTHAQALRRRVVGCR